MLLQSIYLRSAPLLEASILENLSGGGSFLFPGVSPNKLRRHLFGWRVRSEGKGDDRYRL